MPWKCDYYETDTLLRKKGQLSSTWVWLRIFQPLLSTLSKDVYDQEWNPWRWWSWFLIILEISPFFMQVIKLTNQVCLFSKRYCDIHQAHNLNVNRSPNPLLLLASNKKITAWGWTLAQAVGCWHCVFECRKNRQNIFTSKYLHHKHFYETCF